MGETRKTVNSTSRTSSKTNSGAGMDKKTETKKTVKRLDLKVIIIVFVCLIVIGIAAFKIFDLVSVKFAGKYEEVLAGYFKAIVKGDSETITKLTTSDFTNEISHLDLKNGQYSIYVYDNFVLLSNISNNAAVENPEHSYAKLVFSVVGGKVNEQSVSFLNEAYFTLDENSAVSVVKLKKLKKLYKGRLISK